MDTPKVGLLEPGDFSPQAIEQLSAVFAVERFTGGELKRFIADKTVLFVRLKYLIDDALVSNAPRLRYVCSPTTGLNHIQLAPGKIKVLSLQGDYEFLSTIRATPEHAFGLSLALLRNYRQAFLSSVNQAWERERYKGYELYQARVGIIGLGRVGRLLAKYYQTFGAVTGFYDPDPVVDSEGCRHYATLEELISSSQIVLLCANYSEGNRGMLGERHFRLLEDRFFINIARGELLDEQALLAFIRRGRFKGVALDVLSGEVAGLPALGSLLELSQGKNVIITPHIGGATFTSMLRTEEFITTKLLSEFAAAGLVW